MPLLVEEGGADTKVIGEGGAFGGGGGGEARAGGGGLILSAGTSMIQSVLPTGHKHAWASCVLGKRTPEA